MTQINSDYRVLYIHDRTDWAIHNVGKLWLGHLSNVTFKKFNDVTKNDYGNHDLVWFGFTRLAYKCPPPPWHKTVVSLHDPNELFSPHQHWKICRMPLTLHAHEWYEFFSRLPVRSLNHIALKKAKHVVLISNELSKKTKKKFPHAFLIPTTTLLAQRPTLKSFDNMRAITVAGGHYRKNFQLLDVLEKDLLNFSIPLHRKGSEILTESEYIDLLDRHEIYVCTSMQEGGPLPAMDAMARGLVVFTTPVGQIQDIILNGVNGYICRNRKDFLLAFRHFSGLSIEQKAGMSRKAVAAISERSIAKVQTMVSEFLNRID